VNRFDRLVAQSQREIEARSAGSAATATGRYLIEEAAYLLAGLRMWAQFQHQSDQVIREILEAGDSRALRQVARELRKLKIHESRAASTSVGAIAKWPAQQLMAVASYALRAL
jgi:hypothetical protein